MGHQLSKRSDIPEFKIILVDFVIQVTVEGAESPRAEEQRVDDVKKEQLIIQEEEEGDEKKDEEKAVPSDEQPPEVTWTMLPFLHDLVCSKVSFKFSNYQFISGNLPLLVQISK